MDKDKTKPLIYIVDDDDGMRRALSTLATTVGYQVLALARPAEFLAKHDPDQHGCLILDVSMPEMSGLEVQHRLNKNGAMVPVILISGHGDIPMARPPREKVPAARRETRGPIANDCIRTCPFVPLLSRELAACLIV